MILTPASRHSIKQALRRRINQAMRRAYTYRHERRTRGLDDTLPVALEEARERARAANRAISTLGAHTDPNLWREAVEAEKALAQAIDDTRARWGALSR
jgi:NTP pyrophosphatase (non-canonical NTP hydrolase)